MMPLWTTAISDLQSTCGWLFSMAGLPWVAHRVWPTPTGPGRSSRLYFAWTSSSRPLSFLTVILSWSTVTSPTLSYPRYSSRFNAEWIRGAAWEPSCRTQPKIPHKDAHACLNGRLVYCSVRVGIKNSFLVVWAVPGGRGKSCFFLWFGLWYPTRSLYSLYLGGRSFLGETVHFMHF